MIILYLVGFLRTLVIIALIYFGIKVVTKYILPLLLDKGLRNMQQKMNQQQNQQQQSSRKEGEVTIEQQRQNNKNNNQKKGDYIDFEEID